MDGLLPEFQQYKDKIPEFITKLYHILENPAFKDYLCWNGDSEIVIRQPKRMQEKVLPHFFRHRHLSSFVRQLNMYRFSKVIKLTREKNHMYFRNQHFRKGQIAQLTKIKRNDKKSRQDVRSQQSKQGQESFSVDNFSDQKEENISIDLELDRNDQLCDYRNFVKGRVRQITLLLKKIQAKHPEIHSQLIESMTKCHEILEVQSQKENNSSINLDESNHLNRNMMVSMKYLPPLLESVFFPSQNQL